MLLALAKALPASTHSSVIIPQFVKAVDDPSWRVRYVLADTVTQLQAAVDVAISDKHLLPAFVKLLVDPEAEVRTCAAGKVFILYCPLCINSIYLFFVPGARFLSAVRRSQSGAKLL